MGKFSGSTQSGGTKSGPSGSSGDGGKGGGKFGGSTQTGGVKAGPGPVGSGGGGGGKFGGSTQTGGMKPGGSPSPSKSLGERIGDFFGGPEAYKNNMARRQGGVTVPNIPNPSPGQILGSGFMSALMPGPGSLATIAGNVYSGMGNQYGPYGMIGQGIDSMGGWTPGKIEGTAQVGKLNDQGDPGLNRQNGYQMTPGYMAPQPTQPTVNPMPQMQTMNNLFSPGKYMGVAPGYGAGVPGYGYMGPKR